MAAGVKTIKAVAGSVDKIAGNINRRIIETNRTLERKMNKAVNIVYKRATKKRPDVNYIDKMRVSSEFLKISKRGIKRLSRGIRIVSDPEAEYGVPIRTGALKKSIQKEVKFTGVGKIRGKIWTDSPYCLHVEFGTYKMQARPFMRPAFVMSIQEITNIFSDLQDG
jgi:HK97 gp10 family phage protein